jgi:hypothetical protein
MCSPSGLPSGVQRAVPALTVPPPSFPRMRESMLQRSKPVDSRFRGNDDINPNPP